MIKLISPLYVERNKKGDKEYLNLNKYRNWHYQTSNNLKKKYKEVMSKQIACLDYFSEPIEITYTLYPKTKRLCDVANVCCCIDKFFCDALSEMGKVEDDNYLHIPKVHYEFGSVDKDNPRCEILIKRHK